MVEVKHFHFALAFDLRLTSRSKLELGLSSKDDVCDEIDAHRI